MNIWGIKSGIEEIDEQIQSLGKELNGTFSFKEAALKPLWQPLTSIFGYAPDSFFEYGAEGLVAPWPDLVINAHPSTARIALMIKQRSQNKSFLVNLHKPDALANSFDLLVVPEYENFQGPNVLTTTGYLTDVKPEKLMKKNYAYTFSHLPVPQILVMGGGTSQLSETEITQVALDFSHLQQKLSGSLIFLEALDPEQHLQSAIEATSHLAPFIFKSTYPLVGALAWADIVVCMGDDFSALSKACSSGKTVLYYKLDRLIVDGFEAFYQKLALMNMVTNLKDFIQPSDYRPLRESERVASHICQLLHKKNKVNVLL